MEKNEPYQRIEEEDEFEPVKEGTTKKSTLKREDDEKNSKRVESRSKFDLVFIRRFLFLFFTKIGFISIPQLFIFFVLILTSFILASTKLSQISIKTHLVVAFSSKNLTEAWGIFAALTVNLMIDLVCNIVITFIGLLFIYLWRRKLTKNLMEIYFKDKNYYTILNMNVESVDNPDQRLQSDCNDFVTNLAGVLTGGMVNVFTIILNFAYLSSKYYFMLVPVVVMPIINITMYGILFSPVTKMIFKRDKYEGDFRFSHARVREYAESMAFFKSEKVEEKNTDTVFKKLLKTTAGLTMRYFVFNLWGNSQQNLPTFMYMLTLFILLFFDIRPFKKSFTNKQRTEVIMNMYQLATDTGGSISNLFGLSTPFSVVIGNTGRIGEIFEICKKIKKEERGVVLENTQTIKFENVTYSTPKNKLLVRNLNLEVERGKNLLIVGESGCGKSSLLRVLAGLWGFDEGVITRPKRIGLETGGGIFFLPQKPYLIKGTLKDNILYPFVSTSFDCSDKKLIKVMKSAKIEYLLERASLHEKNVNWDERLSLGEQQRVAIARVFLHRPVFAILDESTSALDPDNQDLVYQNLKKEGISFISVAHRKSVMKFHDILLKLNNSDDGTYEIREIDPSMIPVLEDIHWREISSYKVKKSDIDDIEIINKEDLEVMDHKIGKVGINYVFVKRLFKLIFRGILIKNWKQALFCVIGVVVSVLAGLVILPLVALSSLILGAFSSKNLWLSIGCLIVYLVFFLLLSGVLSSISLFYQLQGILFRKNLTEHIHKKYFYNQLFYKVNILDKTVDNMDQRICNDCDLLTSGFVTKPGLSVLENTVLTSLTIMLMTIVGSIVTSGPMTLVFVLLGFVCTALIQLIIMYFVAKYSFLQQKKEGFFRNSLTRLKQYSEQIAFFDGVKKEKLEVEKKFKKVINNQFIVGIIVGLNILFLDLILNFAQLLAVLTFFFGIYVRLFDYDKLTDDQIVSRYTANSTYVVTGIQSLMGVLASGTIISVTIGLTGRVSEMLEKFEEIDEKEKKMEESNTFSKHVESLDFIQFENMICETPSLKKLFFNLSMRVNCNEHLLIRGPSGCGKSSLLRVVGRLWRVREGIVYSPGKIGEGGMFFLPQKPYLILGTLKQQIIYPDSESKMTDDELFVILQQVNLGYIFSRIGGWEEVKELSTILSPGEQQRMGFARLLYHKPLFAILDESTSALDQENEILLYGKCLDYQITLLSVGHRKTLGLYHNRLLQFDGEGSWKFKEKVIVDVEVSKI